jgi:hypothetical protein
MSSKPFFNTACRAAGAALALVFAAATQAATFRIINADNPGVGFNDPTPAAPVGGNTGTTVGEQRQIVFLKVAEIWGQNLRSDVPIRVLATFTPLRCSSDRAVLGAALANNQLYNFPNAERPNTWYPAALANKLAGVALIDDPDPTISADILSFFNSNLGQPGCLDGGGFYLGLDNKAPVELTNLLTVVLHEFGHGLGFATFTDSATGQQDVPVGSTDPNGYPAVWDHYLLDPKIGKVWAAMSNEERVASAITPRNLVWNGERVTRDAPLVLDRGVPELYVTGQGLNRFLMIGEAQFGPIIDKRMLIAQPMVPVVDQATGSTLACNALDATSAAAVRDKVALIDRGTCPLIDKVKNAQNAGAKAVVIADNAPGTPPQPFGAPDESIIIPSVRVTQDDGAAIKAAIAAGRPPFNVPYAVVFQNQLKLAGADYGNRVLMFTPNPRQQGSSVSHYDTSARRNLLMEPNINDDLTLSVHAPEDLTLELLKDIGW